MSFLEGFNKDANNYSKSGYSRPNFDEVSENIRSNSGSLYQSAKEEVKDLYQNVTSGTSNLLGNLENVAESGIKNVSSGVSNLGQSLSEEIKQLYGQAKQNLHLSQPGQSGVMVQPVGSSVATWVVIGIIVLIVLFILFKFIKKSN